MVGLIFIPLSPLIWRPVISTAGWCFSFPRPKNLNFGFFRSLRRSKVSKALDGGGVYIPEYKPRFHHLQTGERTSASPKHPNTQLSSLIFGFFCLLDRVKAPDSQYHHWLHIIKYEPNDDIGCTGTFTLLQRAKNPKTQVNNRLYFTE